MQEERNLFYSLSLKFTVNYDGVVFDAMRWSKWIKLTEFSVGQRWTIIGKLKSEPQNRYVVIEDMVEIGANATIDRATIGSTIIRSGAKLDNLIQVAHNVEVGNNSVIAAQAGVSGSTKIGNNVMIGGQAGIVGHIQIADGSKINAQSGVSKSIKFPNSIVTGSPAHDYTAALRSQALNRNLPGLEKRLSELERQLKLMRAEQESKPSS